MKTDLHWQSVGRRSHHGIALPLSALWTERGPATFLDLIPLIDWCAEVGFDVIQLLPLNDSGIDPSPYNPISSCALNPKYLAKESVDESSYKQFCQENNDWLKAYGHAEIQYRCFSQMRKVKEYATRKKVYLMGDIPILISPKSVDVLAEPELFDLSKEAGAPPDQYNLEGQHWGFPLVRWDVMKENNYAWWKRRLRVASELYHIYRVDHVVGLFRMWAHKVGFIPPDPSLWPTQGREILEMMLQSTSMLPIAEDLGGGDTLSDVVRPMLKELGICGTKVMRWEPDVPYEPYSLTTVSTHDSEPLLLWWESEYRKPLTPDHHFELIRNSHHTSSYFHVNPLQEYFALIPELTRPPEQERINVPGTISPQNWTYKFKPPLEAFTRHKGLKIMIQNLLA